MLANISEGIFCLYMRIKKLKKLRQKKVYHLSERQLAFKALKISKKDFQKVPREKPIRLEPHERLYRAEIHLENEDQVKRILGIKT